MRQQYVAQKVSVTKRYLNVQTRIEHGSTIRWAQVKVPLRLLNEIYEDLGNAMGAEANDQVSSVWRPAEVLPLESWE